MPALTSPARPYRPPAPIPLVRPLSPLGLILGLRNNPLATWGIWNFEQPVISSDTIIGHLTVLSAPEGVKHVLVDNAANYIKDDLQRRVLQPGLGEGLLTAEGDSWRKARRTLAPIFSPRSVEGFAQAMQDKSESLATRLARMPPGSRVDVTAEMTRITFEILTATLFSDAIETEPSEFAAAFTSYFESQGRVSPLDLLKAPDWIPRLGRFRSASAIAFFEDQVKRIIGKRRTLITSGRTVPRDLLTLLLEASDPETGQGLTEAEIGANIVTFIGAGHETTSNSLQWAIFLLSKHPRVLEEAEREADGADKFLVVEWLDRLPLIRAVVEEAMRLYPPAATLTRAAVNEDFVLGKVVPKGTTVVMSPYVIHRHRKLWTEPDLFRPERFLPGNREKIDRFAYLPFGAGPRICIGLRFAMHEAIIILTHLLRQIRFVMAHGEGVTPVQRITLRPSPRLSMLVTARR